VEVVVRVQVSNQHLARHSKCTGYRYKPSLHTNFTVTLHPRSRYDNLYFQEGNFIIEEKESKLCKFKGSNYLRNSLTWSTRR
jgi:hypothetical protein